MVSTFLLWLVNMLHKTLIFWNLLIFLEQPGLWFKLVNVPYALKRMCILKLLGVAFFKCLLIKMVDIAVIITSLSLCDSFLHSCFWYYWQCWGLLLRCTLVCPSARIYQIVFLVSLGRGCGGSGLRVFWKKIIQSVIFIIYQEYILSTWSKTIDVDFDHLADGMFARFCRYKFTLNSPLTMCIPCLRNRELCFPSFGVGHLHKLFGVFLHDKFVSFPQ